MLVFTTASEMQTWSQEQAQKGRAIGFVPTMGALHEGHRSLIKTAQQENDLTVVSIFVNPLQFGPAEDFTRYPRPFDTDSDLCEREGVDVVFHPDENTFYEKPHLTMIKMTKLTDVLCGKSRPGHFDGVCTVVAKLFECVRPNRAYFGKKDFQQYRIVDKMVRDLSMQVKVVPCQLVRDVDGMALSSRNKYLSESERIIARHISQALFTVRDQIEKGEKESSAIRSVLLKILETQGLTVEYAEIVDDESLQPVELVTSHTLIAIAARVGKTRLIDNIHTAELNIGQ